MNIIDFLAALIQEHIISEMGIVVVVLLLIGFIVKQTPFIADWTIVWILPVVGAILAMTMLGFTAQMFVQGILAAGMAVLMHQAFKQTKNRE